MQVQVHLFSILREHLPPGGERGRATVMLSEGATIADLIAYLGITRRVRLVIVNDVFEENWKRLLQEGDQIKLVPPMVGG